MKDVHDKESFTDKYNKLVEEMCEYLREDGLDMITWTYENGNKFRIKLSNKFFKEKNG